MASFVVAHLIYKRAGSVVAIDADPNSCFAEALGVKNAGTIVGICEEISKNMDKIPGGMTKDRYIEMEVQESVIEEKNFDLLVMGRPEGPGCYCYVNNLLRGIIEKITSSYDYVVIDNAAGMEHISRRTVGVLNKLVVVSDYSVTGVRAAKKIYELAIELGIKIGAAYLIINKITGPASSLKDEIQKSGLDLIGEIPYSEDLVRWNISNRPIFEFKNQMIDEKVAAVVEKLKGEKYAGRVN
ncbi:MAG: carbon monoxide dehydrogenase [Candidatus Omnitrophica bacterium]|nr:carbon monoxide dehydrogenase [Candidatus Omnitrophota bacterium]